MLESLRRLLNKGHDSVDMSGLQAWAQSRGLRFKRVKEVDGGLVEPVQPAKPAWRIEWGESQRHYIVGREVRFSAEIGTPRELQVMVLNRELMEQVESAVFEQYVEDVQTRIDTETPPEMRWLVMYPKLGATEMGSARDRYAAVSSAKGWLQKWLAGPLEKALAVSATASDEATPVVLTISRGRLTLRTPMATPDAQALSLWMGVFECAARQAHALAGEAIELGGHGHSPASTWPSSEVPDKDA